MMSQIEKTDWKSISKVSLSYRMPNSGSKQALYEIPAPCTVRLSNERK
jgi:hypothetical protein